MLRQGLALGFGIALMNACLLDFEKFNYSNDFGRGADGSSASASTASSARSSGAGAATSASSASASSGGSGGGECSAPTDCPGIDSACSARRCENAVCNVENALPGTDCSADGGVACDGSGNCLGCGSSATPAGGACPPACDSCANDTCVIVCDQPDECRNITVTCPDGFDCTITCSGNSSCRNASLVCPSATSCTIGCNGPDACRDATIECQSGACNLSCGSSCRDAEFNCGPNGCTASCGGPPLDDATVNCGPSCGCDDGGSCDCVGCP